jgi:hypothetical protein
LSYVTKALEDVFETQGNPSKIKSDNGPPFQHGDFKVWAEERGIKIVHSIPLWAQSNGTIERVFRNINDGLRKAKALAQVEQVNVDYDAELKKIVSGYNQTPHSMTGVPPEKLLFRRDVRRDLPNRRRRDDLVLDNDVRERDYEKKINSTEYANRKRGAVVKEFHVGDKVLLKQPRLNKLTPIFGAIEYEIISIDGALIEVLSPGGRVYKRASSDIKLVSGR